ncbi:hypothetical protein M3Y98_00449300 [Aphelenchoides besseyi]|nr:hypothetical protein M3Y98_00449300 [Aphelenchoides besseyi]KAI6207373.1 hypothetical protein M3Y96_00002300 [Aphelenchoides besseyi]
MVKILFLTALVVTSIGVVSPCAPPTLQQQYMSGTVPQTNIPAGVPEHYIRQYQQLHRDNPCVQCDAIVAQSSCSNHWHNSQFSCPTPRIAYGLNGQCGQATITCAPDQSTGHPMMVVALLDNSDGRFGQNAQVYAPISSLGNGRAVSQQGCTMESTWSRQSMDNFRLAQPLTVQCAHQVDGYVMPPNAERYRSFQQSTQPAPQSTYRAPQPQAYVAPQPIIHEVQPAQYVETSQNADGVVVDEDVRVEIIGTTLIPIVKERVVQNVIKEIHNYPIQKKRIIKTKHISKPTEEHREYIERVPATRIVPTFEERRATQVIRGTTLVPMVEEIEVTEMLPEVTEAPAVVHRPTYRRVVRPVAVVKNSAYETVPEQTSSIQETRAEQGYGKNQPQQTSYGENSAPNGYEQSTTGSNVYQQSVFSGFQPQHRNQNQRLDQQQPYVRPQQSQESFFQPHYSSTSQQLTRTSVPLDVSSQQTNQPLSTKQPDESLQSEQPQNRTDAPIAKPESRTDEQHPKETQQPAKPQKSFPEHPEGAAESPFLTERPKLFTVRPEDLQPQTRKKTKAQETTRRSEQTTQFEDFESTTRTFSTERSENSQRTRQETEQPHPQEFRTKEPENVTETAESQSTSLNALTQQSEEMTDRLEHSKTQRPRVKATASPQPTLPPVIEDDNQSTSQPERQEFATDQSVVFPAPTKKALVIQVPQEKLEHAIILPIIEDEEEPVSVSSTESSINVTMIPI